MEVSREKLQLVVDLITRFRTAKAKTLQTSSWQSHKLSDLRPYFPGRSRKMSSIYFSMVDGSDQVQDDRHLWVH